MLKKILMISLVTTTINAAIATPLANTISYQFHDTASISSSTALVNIKFYSTSLANNNANIRQSALSMLSNIMPHEQFKVVNYTESKSASGAINAELNIQSRLTQNQVDKLKSELNKNSNNDESIKVDILNFLPSTEALNNAKQQLMVSMYNKVKNYPTFKSVTDAV